MSSTKQTGNKANERAAKKAALNPPVVGKLGILHGKQIRPFGARIHDADMRDEEQATLRAKQGRPEGSVEPTSRTSRIAALSPGQIMSEAELVPASTTLYDLAKNGTAMRNKFRNRIESSVRAAKQITEATYMVEVVSAMTTQDRMYLVAIVTCISW